MQPPRAPPSSGLGNTGGPQWDLGDLNRRRAQPRPPIADDSGATTSTSTTSDPRDGRSFGADAIQLGNSNDALIDQLIREGLQGSTFSDVTLNADPFRDVTLPDNYRDISIKADPFKNVTMGGDPFQKVGINYTGDPEIDALLRENTKRLLSEREGDTTDEEGLINQRIKDQLGQSLVGQRASMGRAGFGSSGALSAMEGDTTRLANQDALEQILAMREREQEQAFRRTQAGADTAMRRDEQMYGRATDLADLDFENQAAAHQRAREQAALDFQNQEVGYGRATDQARLDTQNQEARYGRAQDRASLDRQNQMDAYARTQDQANLDFRNQETQFGQRIESADLNTRQQQAENEAALLEARLQAMDELANPTEPAGAADVNSDGEVSATERRDFISGHETVDLGLGGNDTPGSADTPYLTTSAEMQQMADMGINLTLDPAYPNGIDRRFTDGEGHYWFIRGQT